MHRPGRNSNSEGYAMIKSDLVISVMLRRDRATTCDQADSTELQVSCAATFEDFSLLDCFY